MALTTISVSSSVECTTTSALASLVSVVSELESTLLLILKTLDGDTSTLSFNIDSQVGFMGGVMINDRKCMCVLIVLSSTLLAGEMFAHYPMKFTKMQCFNTNQVANMVWSLLKKVYPRSIMNVLQLGCQLPADPNQQKCRTLREIHLQPDLETASIRMLSRAKELLILRRRNEEMFRL
jgi:hypothetical protein